MRRTCLDSVYRLAKEDPRIVFIGSDLGSGTLDAFKREMPERFFMEGISEAHVVGMAAGMALEGRIVYLNTIATFLTRRCYEQVVLDLCLHRARVRLIGSGGGLVYAPLGPTHEAIEDVAILRPLPGMRILAPADAEEMARIMPHTVEPEGPIYIRLGKGGDPVVTDPAQPFRWGMPALLRPGRGILLITTGTAAGLVLEAAARLAAAGHDPAVLHLPCLKPIHLEALRAHLAPMGTVVTVEEHVVTGGLGSLVAEVLAETPFPVPKRFRRVGLGDAFPEGYGSQASLMGMCGVSAEAVVSTVLGLLA
jgi:transketolase